MASFDYYDSCEKFLLACGLQTNLTYVMQCIETYKYDINLTDSFGKNGLHHACRWGQLQTVTYLLSKNIRLNKKDNSGNTPLHYASEEGYTEIVKLLLIFGANTKLKNKTNQTAKRKAELSGYKHIMAIIDGFTVRVEEFKRKMWNASKGDLLCDIVIN